MPNNTTVIRAEKLRTAATKFSDVADYTNSALTAFNQSTANDTSPPPWGSDEIGNNFSKYYNQAQSDTKKALNDVVEGCTNVSYHFSTAATQYETTEQHNAGG